MMDDDDADLDFSQERKVDFTKNLGSVFFLSHKNSCLVDSKGWCDNDRRRHAQGHFDHQHGLHADDSQQQRAKLHTLE